MFLVNNTPLKLGTLPELITTQELSITGSSLFKTYKMADRNAIKKPRGLFVNQFLEGKTVIKVSWYVSKNQKDGIPFVINSFPQKRSIAQNLLEFTFNMCLKLLILYQLFKCIYTTLNANRYERCISTGMYFRETNNNWFSKFQDTLPKSYLNYLINYCETKSLQRMQDNPRQHVSWNVQ